MIDRLAKTDVDVESLANLKVDPKTQENDHFDYSKVVVKKPWGYEYLIYENNEVSVWILYIKKGFQSSLHAHPHKKTSLVILSGSAVCTSINKRFDRSVGQGLLIDKGVFHCTKAVSDERTFVMEIETPINKRDLVRLNDPYGRVGKGYETIKEMSFNTRNYNYISLIDREVYYNTKKKFGRCSISLAKFNSDEDFQKNFALDADALSVLKGTLCDADGKSLLEAGDTRDRKSIESLPRLHCKGATEILQIKKRDQMVKLSDYLVWMLDQHEVDTLFVVPGSANLHMLDSIGKYTDITHIHTQTEQAAGLAAEGYAKLTGKIGIAVVSSGRSSANALEGVADAWVDSTPMLIISGQAQSDQSADDTGLRQHGIQELDIISMVKPITKYAVKISDPSSIRYCLEEALYHATHGRPGPVWIDIPIDLQGMNIDEEELHAFSPDSEKFSPTVMQLAQSLSMLTSARRPVIIAGRGIRLAHAKDKFERLVDTVLAPVLTSKGGSDILSPENAMYYGRHGAYGQRHANFIVQNADLILSIGSRLSLPQIGRNYLAFAREAKKIVVDIEKSELHKNTIQPDLAIQVDAGNFIDALQRVVDKNGLPSYDSWLKRCDRWKQKFSQMYGPGSRDKVNPYAFIEALADELSDDDIICVDGGAPIVMMMQVFVSKKNQRIISADGLDNPSFALCASIGACVGSGKRVVALCEDPGFQTHVQELETIFRNNLPIKIFVLNTKGYSYLKKSQKEYFGSRFVASSRSDLPNISDIGTAYGLNSVKLSDPADMAVLIRQVLAQDGPSVCEVMVDPDQEIEPRIVFAVRPDGKWLAKPLEDMYPYLSRKEFKENMVIDELRED